MGIAKNIVFGIAAVSLLGAVAAPKGEGASSASAPAVLSRSEALKNIRVTSFRGDKGGFGTVLIASYVVNNDNNFAIKDVEVTCTHITNSGTLISSNSRVEYERISPRGFYAAHDVNMGFIHSSATRTRCEVTGFSRA